MRLAGWSGSDPASPIGLRFLTAALLIVVSVAAATAISLLVYIDDLFADADRDPSIDRLPFDQVEGDARTILILGSDERPGDGDDTERSDTTIVLRVDPDRDRMAMLSIPRDLRVDIPGYGEDKLNAAYTYGGPKLTFEVVHDLLDTDINHLVNVDFNGFADAVDAIGCVYVDVDRHYFIPPESGIAEIDVEAGYQRLCGLKALQYVRYRHGDTDIVRSARQQDFLREVRQALSPGRIVNDSGYREDLVDVVVENTTTDVHGVAELLAVTRSFVGAAGTPLQEVPFPAQLGDADAVYVEADPEAIEKAVDELMGEGVGNEPEGGTNAKPDEEKRSGGAGGKDDDKPSSDGDLPIADAAAQGEQVARELAATKQKDGDPMLGFPVQYPTAVLEGSSPQATGGDSRAFPIDGPGDDAYHGYKIVIDYFGKGGFDEYYGLSGTDWLEAPILADPSETREIGGNEYELYFDGDRLRMVAWRTRRAAYWVNNTLTQALDSDVMLEIAVSARTLGG